jgi:hypothetical protein
VAGRLKVEVGGVLGVALVVGNQLDLDVRVRVRSWPVKPSFSAVKVPMLAMMFLLSG